MDHLHDSNQHQFEETILKGHNGDTKASPGAGKTATVLRAVRRSVDKQFCILTYNKKLKTDTQLEIDKSGFGSRASVYTYHQFIHYNYDSSVSDDWGIVNVLFKRFGFQFQHSTMKTYRCFA